MRVGEGLSESVRQATVEVGVRNEEERTRTKKEDGRNEERWRVRRVR